MLFDIPDNLEITAAQAAQIAGCCKKTIINHTDLKLKEEKPRVFIPSRRNGKMGTILIMFKDFRDYYHRTKRGYLPGEENLTT